MSEINLDCKLVTYITVRSGLTVVILTTTSIHGPEVLQCNKRHRYSSSIKGPVHPKIVILSLLAVCFAGC